MLTQLLWPRATWLYGHSFGWLSNRFHFALAGAIEAHSRVGGGTRGGQFVFLDLRQSRRCEMVDKRQKKKKAEAPKENDLLSILAMGHGKLGTRYGVGIGPGLKTQTGCGCGCDAAFHFLPPSLSLSFFSSSSQTLAIISAHQLHHFLCSPSAQYLNKPHPSSEKLQK